MSDSPTNDNGIAIFPGVTIRERDKGGVWEFTIETYIRKQHTDGKWYLSYLMLFRKGLETKNEAFKAFVRECYFFLVSGKIDPTAEAACSPGEVLFKLDEYQGTEQERLWEQYAVKASAKRYFWHVTANTNGDLTCVTVVNFQPMSGRTEGDYTDTEIQKLDKIFLEKYSNYKFKVSDSLAVIENDVKELAKL